MIDPYVLEMFMDNTTPGVEEVAHVAALLVENTCETSSIIQNQREKGTLIKNPKVPKILRKRSFKHSMLLIDKFINNCSNKKYYERFGMTRTRAQELISYVTTRMKQQSAEVPKYRQIPMDKKIHVFIHLLRTRDSFKKFVSKFGLCRTTLLANFQHICSVFASFKDDLIRFPDSEKQTLIKQQIDKKYQFPNCIGFIDTCTIYVNQCPLTVEAICDHNLVFYYFKCNPKQSFLGSQLGRKLNEIVNHGNHLLGSSQYPLLVNLLTPFDESANQTSFNKIHFKAWSNVQQAFEALKSTLRRLSALQFTLGKPSDVVYAACFLHNFVRLSSLKDVVLDNSCDDSLQISVEVNAFDKRQLINETIQVTFN